MHFPYSSYIPISGILTEIFILICCNVNTIIYNDVKEEKSIIDGLPTKNPVSIAPFYRK